MPTTPHRPAALGRKPFRGSHAVASGLLTARQLQSAAWRRLFQDVYIDSRAVVTHQLRCQALTLRLPPEAVVTGRSAAQLWGARMGDADDPIEVLNPRRLVCAGTKSVAGALDPVERTRRYGVPVPSSLHTTWELARMLPMVEAVAWIDALAHARNLPTAALLDHAFGHIGERGSPQAMKTLPRCDGRAESPPESRLRVEIILAGLPPPVPQWEVMSDGYFVARVDLAWPQWRFAIEYDGQWHAGRDQLHRDRARLRDLNAAGWHVFPVTRKDMRDLPRLIAGIRRALAARSRETAGNQRLDLG